MCPAIPGLGPLGVAAQGAQGSQRCHDDTITEGFLQCVEERFTAGCQEGLKPGTVGRGFPGRKEHWQERRRREHLKGETGMWFWGAKVTFVEWSCGSHAGQSWEPWPGSGDL